MAPRRSVRPPPVDCVWLALVVVAAAVGKKGVISKQEKSARENMSNNDNDDDDIIVTDAAAKAKFEKEKERTLADLPQAITSMFGQVGFGRISVDDDSDDDDDDDKQSSEEADTRIVPVLIVNPYHVPPKPVRDVYWFGLYMAAKRKKTLGTLAYLCYHYGATDPDDCYSFLEHDMFVPYADGCAQGWHKIPDELQSKDPDSLSEQGTCVCVCCCCCRRRHVFLDCRVVDLCVPPRVECRWKFFF